MYELFFCHVHTQTTTALRMAVLRTSTCDSKDEIALLPTNHSETYILARTESGEKLLFDTRKESFITSSKTISLVKDLFCSRCSSTGLYQAPTGVNMSARIRGVKGSVNMPLCFDCHGKGFLNVQPEPTYAPPTCPGCWQYHTDPDHTYCEWCRDGGLKD